MHLHSISQSKVDHIIAQLKEGQVTARYSVRGKHSNRSSKIPEYQREAIRNHIRQFPAEHFHYSRSRNSNRMYLSPTVNIISMYKEYKKTCLCEINLLYQSLCIGPFL